MQSQQCRCCCRIDSHVRHGAQAWAPAGCLLLGRRRIIPKSTTPFASRVRTTCEIASRAPRAVLCAMVRTPHACTHAQAGNALFPARPHLHVLHVCLEMHALPGGHRVLRGGSRGWVPRPFCMTACRHPDCTGRCAGWGASTAPLQCQKGAQLAGLPAGHALPDQRSPHSPCGGVRTPNPFNKKTPWSALTPQKRLARVAEPWPARPHPFT